MDNLIIGTAQFGLDYGINNLAGQIKFPEAKRILNYAKNCGIDTLDTAQAYGASEKVLGTLIGGEKCFKIITKISPDVKTRLALRKSLRQSFKLLKQSRVSTCYFHSFNSFKKNPRLLDELVELKQDGYIDKIGFSLYHPSELEYLIKNNLSPDIIQIPYSVFDTRFEKSLEKAKKRKIEVHARSVYLQGLVFKDPDQLENDFKEVKKSLIKLRNISAEAKLSIGAICLNFVYLNPKIDKIVIGVDSLAQLKENVEDLSRRNQNKVKKILKKLQKLSVVSEREILPINWGKK